jgi:hypothetical protein
MYVRQNAMYKHQLTQNCENYLDSTDPEDGGSKPSETLVLPVYRCEKPKQPFFYELQAKILSFTIFHKFVGNFV